MAAETAKPWWQSEVIYHIFPRSFSDSNGDGVGDLNGITQHLDYLQWLGVGAIWMSPIHPSPNADYGYDVADYTGVNPEFGTLADFDRLLAEANKHGIKVMLDLVPNHTSDKHPWFVESASSRTNPKADWYVWSDGVKADTASLSAIQARNVHDGMAPPNNWSGGGGSAWEWSPVRKQFYFHRFSKGQPDLNWRTPAVEKAMFDGMRFWLDRGVAGFRVDVPSGLFEDAQLRSEEEMGFNARGAPILRRVNTGELPETHELFSRMRKMVDSYPGNRVLVGETFPTDMQSLNRWYSGPFGKELHLPMYQAMGRDQKATYTAAWFRPHLKSTQTEINGELPNYVFDNHDIDRSIDRFGDGLHDVEFAKGIATILLASRSAPIVYYGSEIGMRTLTPMRKEDLRDPFAFNSWPANRGRDGERTPMQWNSDVSAGFSTNRRTWLPVDPWPSAPNVAAQRAEPTSQLNWARTLIHLRKSEPALADGVMTLVAEDDAEVLAWTRTAGDRKVLVAINMSGKARDFQLTGDAGERLAATGSASAAGRTLKLDPYGVWIGRIR